MISLQSYCPILSVSLLAAVGSIGAQVSTEPFIYAEFQPGGTCHDCFGWRLTVLEDGTVTQEVKNVPGWRAPDEWSMRYTAQLSKRRLDRIRSLIQQVGFSTLRDEYSAQYDLGDGRWRVVTDQDTDVLAIAVQGNMKRVTVYGPEDIAGIWHPDRVHPDQEAGQRFIAVWAEVLTIARAPNSWQKARVYR